MNPFFVHEGEKNPLPYPMQFERLKSALGRYPSPQGPNKADEAGMAGPPRQRKVVRDRDLESQNYPETPNPHGEG